MTGLFREENRDFYAWIEAQKWLVDWVKTPPVLLDEQKYPVIVREVNAIRKRAKLDPITLYTANMPIPHVVCMPGTPDKSKLVISNLLLESPFKEEQVAMYIAHELGHEFNGIKHSFSKWEHKAVVPASLAGAVGLKIVDDRIRDKKNQTRRNFIAQVASMTAIAFGGFHFTDKVLEHNNVTRETETDNIAISLYNKPDILEAMLLNMRRWCQETASTLYNNPDLLHRETLVMRNWCQDNDEAKQKFPETVYPGITARIENAQRIVESNRRMGRQ